MMPKFNIGDRVIYQNQLATIMDVHNYLPTKSGKKRLLWYSVRLDGMRSQYAVAQKTNSLVKAKEAK
jgi:hypothetical protein